MKKFAVIGLALVASSAFAQVYTGSGSALADGGNLSFTAPGITSYTFNVTSDVSAVNFVELRDFTHTWIGDITVTLSNSLGSATILNRTGSISATSFGDSSDVNGVYNFAVGGASFHTAAAGGATAFVIPGGNYAPNSSDFASATGEVLNNYSALVGAGSAGTWTLTVTDWTSGDTGALGAYAVSVEAVPEPATMTVLGLAALAAARRRKQK